MSYWDEEAQKGDIGCNGSLMQFPAVPVAPPPEQPFPKTKKKTTAKKAKFI